MYSLASVADQSSPMGFHHLIQRLGKAARMPFAVHPHMLRHACGFKLANDGHDTRGHCSTTSGTRTSTTPSGTPTWRPTVSRTFGGTDYSGADEVADEHIYWDQASLLIQIGLLDLAKLPAGRRTAKIVPFEEDDAIS